MVLPVYRREIRYSTLSIFRSVLCFSAKHQLHVYHCKNACCMSFLLTGYLICRAATSTTRTSCLVSRCWCPSPGTTAPTTRSTTVCSTACRESPQPQQYCSFPYLDTHKQSVCYLSNILTLVAGAMWKCQTQMINGGSRMKTCKLSMTVYTTLGLVCSIM